MCNDQADSPLYVWPYSVWSGDLQVVENLFIHETEYPYWDQVSLNNPNPNSQLRCVEDISLTY